MPLEVTNVKIQGFDTELKLRQKISVPANSVKQSSHHHSKCWQRFNKVALATIVKKLWQMSTHYVDFNRQKLQ